MKEPQDEKERLLTHIARRRRSANDYVKTARPRSERLTLTSIISSAAAAALTAGPALGGATFTLLLADTFGLSGSAAVWRPLCLLAMIVSIVAAISANLSKSKNTEARISSAEICATELDLLATFLEFDKITCDEALMRFQESVTKIPFIQDELPLRPN